jgi:hypothetical protein
MREIYPLKSSLELASIVHSLMKWRNHLMGKRFEPRTDHNGLKYLFDQPTLNSMQSRWLEFLNEYDFDIKHIKGKEKKVDDALNRRVHELYATTISMYRSDLKDKFVEAAKSDLQYMELVTKLQQGKMQQKIEDYELGVDGILLYKNIFYVPNSYELRSEILKEIHNVPYAGHHDIKKQFHQSKSNIIGQT